LTGVWPTAMALSPVNVTRRAETTPTDALIKARMNRLAS
jgi:hypothetical protein